ncbi:MAG TPA: hypothetical protein VFL12_11485 [Thermoanaerobaculia bacterium]|nr:hypothetical protein [Thermoanaerobaculia bacterium]
MNAAAASRFTCNLLVDSGGSYSVGLPERHFHLRGNLANPGRTLWERFLYGAPIFAPLLFANLAALAAIAIGTMLSRRRTL